MVPVAALPVAGIRADGTLVTHKIFPGGVAKIDVLGLWSDPVGDKLESDRVQPAAFDPETILVPVPFMYMVLFKAGAPLVILSILPEI